MDHGKKQGAKTIGQARDQAEPKAAQPSSTMGGNDKADRMKSKTTTGQAQDQMKTDKAAPSASSGKMGAQPNAGQSAQGSSSAGATTGSSASSATQLTTEQRTEVREKVLVNAPRESDVTFAVNVGTVVPRTVHVATVPEMLIRIHPEWRGHRFFVVRDEIIIVDSDFRIIAVLPV
jgi:hypothetical protein